jgi:anaerobic magnesium-protoporphyrin IX monomethyl ester cyclase
MKVQLIQPEKDPGYGNNSRSGCYLPLGLLSIANYLKKKDSSLDIEVLDGELISNQEIISQLKENSIVGIETKALNYESALEIARTAKEKNSKVVLGGVYASALPQIIIDKRKDLIDHVVVGYGEQPFKQILKGTKKKIIYNPRPSFDLVPLIDRSFVDVEKYISNFQEKHPSWNYKGTNIFTHMGCINDCLFCSRSGPSKPFYRNPAHVWQEARYLKDQYGVDYLVDFSDTLTQNIRSLEKLVKAKPTDLNPAFHVFSTAQGINEKSIGLLKELNVKHVFIGVETGDPILAKGISKGNNFSPDKTIEAVKMLTDYGINITPSFVLGLPGENKETLERTLKIAEQIKEISNFEEIFCCELIPFPGSRAFNMICPNPQTDSFDPDKLKQEWIGKYCHASFEKIREVVNEILGLGDYTITIRKS